MTNLFFRLPFCFISSMNVPEFTTTIGEKGAILEEEMTVGEGGSHSPKCLYIVYHRYQTEERTEVHGEVNSAAALDASEVNLVLSLNGANEMVERQKATASPPPASPVKHLPDESVSELKQAECRSSLTSMPSVIPCPARNSFSDRKLVNNGMKEFVINSETVVFGDVESRMYVLSIIFGSYQSCNKSSSCWCERFQCGSNGRELAQLFEFWRLAVRWIFGW
ncbi:hypothetical protein L2E82_25555 [Cichorium intybus]|uniref:Uncharacterized protein n=1 Tax=Cichorium intybus TaxID=13427 RepID=A0ACB9E456_CICIN|nr:hypothetical protein L2E82_25555 [Cichorium intybus]